MWRCCRCHCDVACVLNLEASSPSGRPFASGARILSWGCLGSFFSKFQRRVACKKESMRKLIIAILAKLQKDRQKAQESFAGCFHCAGSSCRLVNNSPAQPSGSLGSSSPGSASHNRQTPSSPATHYQKHEPWTVYSELWTSLKKRNLEIDVCSLVKANKDPRILLWSDRPYDMNYYSTMDSQW